MQHQFTMATDAHNRNAKEWNTWIELFNSLSTPFAPSCARLCPALPKPNLAPSSTTAKKRA
jgi:hypothetical protein